jgi:hypothetical protein
MTFALVFGVAERLSQDGTTATRPITTVLRMRPQSSENQKV